MDTGRVPSWNRSLVAVPAGKYEIAAAARLWDTTLTVQITSATSSLLMIQDYTGKVVNEIRGVDSLVTSADGKYVAYASGGQFSDGRTGGTVYFQEHGNEPGVVLHQPKVNDLHVLAVVGRAVYFRGGTTPDSTWSLYRWDVASGTTGRSPSPARLWSAARSAPVIANWPHPCPRNPFSSDHEGGGARVLGVR